jgi:hypothetical protein
MYQDRMGFKQHLLIEDPLVRKGSELWLQRILGYYGRTGGVDVEIVAGQLNLCGKTAPYIYSEEFTPLTTRYQPGSRPMLEKIVMDLVGHVSDPRQKALAICRWVRDNRDRGQKGKLPFCGGTEEELVKRGAIMCNEVSRLFCALAQIAGLPARVFAAHISGHMMTEVHVGEGWWWMDPMKGMYCYKDDTSVASAWDLKLDPELFDRQDEHVWLDCRPVGPFETKGFEELNKAFAQAKCKHCYFFEKEANAIGNYFVWEHHKYTYPWITETADPEGLEQARREEYLNRKELGWPDWYFCHYLFNGSLEFLPSAKRQATRRGVPNG